MPGSLSTYGFLNSKLKARIGNLLSEEKMDELTTAHSLSEALFLLKGTPFEDLEEVYSRTGDLRDVEAVLAEREVTLYTELLPLVKEPVLSVVNALARRLEVAALKNALRLWFDRHVRNRDIKEYAGSIYRGRIIHDMKLDAVLEAPDLDGIVRALEGTPYAASVREAGETVLASKSLFPVETALDRQYYLSLLESLEKLDKENRDIARRIIAVEIDVHNIRWLFRAKTFYNLPIDEALSCLIPGGMYISRDGIAGAYASENASELLSVLFKEQYARFRALVSRASESRSRLSILDRSLREIIVAEAQRTLSGYPFTIGTTLAYFVLKREEIRTLYVVLNAKYYMLSFERIRNAL
jgi:V/A-type H+-transporting ATPase subunit C